MRKGKELTNTQVAIKSLLTFSIPLLIILCVVPGPGGKPVIRPNDLLPDTETINQAKLMIKSLLPQPDDKPMYKWQDTDGSWQISEEVPEFAKNSAKLEQPGTISSLSPLTSSTRVIYKWQDKHGNWYFSEDVPEHAKDIAEPMTISSDINTVNMRVEEPGLLEQAIDPKNLLQGLKNKQQPSQQSP